MGLDIYLCTKDQHESNARYVPSHQYPGHLCNRRYLRSSYNSGGFNSAVPSMIGEDHGFYWIFEPLDREWDGDAGLLTSETIPALQEARKRAEQVANEIREFDSLQVMTANAHLGSSPHMWSQLPTEDQVLEWYRDEQKREHGPFGDGGYSNAKGLVLGFQTGTEVLALTVGQDILGQPAAVAVYRMGVDSKEHYVQTAEITAELCDEAITLIRRDGVAYLVWSG